MSEIWKSVGIINGIDFTGLYEVSDLAQIKSIASNGVGINHGKNNIVLKQSNGKYRMVTLVKDKIHYGITVHKIVCTAFNLNPHNKSEINHKDGNRWNNLPINLEWCTRQENIDHSIQTGLKRILKKGEQLPQTKMRDDNKRIIKFLKGRVYQKDLAEIYGVSIATISRTQI